MKLFSVLLSLFFVTLTLPVSADKGARDRAYKEIISKVAKFTTYYVDNSECGKSSRYHATGAYFKKTSPKVMYTCVDWRSSSLGDMVVRASTHRCGKPITQLKKDTYNECLKYASNTSCRCTLLDINGKNALPMRYVKKYLIK